MIVCIDRLKAFLYIAHLLSNGNGISMKSIFYLAALLPTSLSAFISTYQFVNKDYPQRHHEAFIRKWGTTKFKGPDDVKNTKLNYFDAQSSYFFNKYLDDETAVNWEVGYNHFNLKWDENPHFKNNDYHQLKTTLALISDVNDKLRFVSAAGTVVDATTFNFSNAGLMYSALWCEYAFLPNYKFHWGGFGYFGIKEAIALPIIGIEGQPFKKLRFKFVYPLEGTITYSIGNGWSIVGSASYFGDFYQMPIRAHRGIGDFKNGIFTIHADGMDLNLVYSYKGAIIGVIGAGRHSGGWMHIRDENDQNGVKYKFKGAPYGQARLYLTF